MGDSVYLTDAEIRIIRAGLSSVNKQAITLGLGEMIENLQRKLAKAQKKRRRSA